ncbi:MAG: NrfD/PsrC family molybdoenzyme membrane anchor subunit, partial [Ktedonobacteraceae bacterium]
MERQRHGGPQGYDGGQGQRERRLDTERRGESDAEGTSYYNRPMIKKPTWKWYIPLYFFIGGLGGGVALIGGLADLFGGRRHRATVRRARYIALAAALISPLLLILDLGRPKR